MMFFQTPLLTIREQT